MNKKELIKHFEDMPYVSVTQMGKKSFIDLIEQLDEPKEKVTIPQLVADWIEVCKEYLTSSLYLAMTPSFLKANNQSIELILWIKKKENQETFALAWINGYEVEKEKRYIVKVKGISVVNGCLKCDVDNSKWFFSGPEESDRYRAKHTIKELDKAGFGWVFDCTGIEIEEAAE